jgi:hypothetical protein
LQEAILASILRSPPDRLPRRGIHPLDAVRAKPLLCFELQDGDQIDSVNE